MNAPAAGPYEFDLATTVHAQPDGVTWDFQVDQGFTVGPKPNGGYLLAAAARATAEALAAAGSSHHDALVATAHFLRAPDPGPASVVVDVMRTGRSASQARAVVEQDGQRCVDITMTMGTLPDEPTEPLWSALTLPAVAPIEACIRVPAHREGMAFEVAMNSRNDLRLDPESTGFATGQPSGRGDLRGWIAAADGRPPDPLSVLFFLDSMPPATFDIGSAGWVPTLSLTTYLRARPAPGPLRVVQRAQLVADQRFDEVCELWDSADRLVGQATQMAGVRFPPDGVVPPPG